MEIFIFYAMMEIQNNHVPRKKGHVRDAHSTFMTETLSKKIMKRKILGNQCDESKN